MKSVVLIESNSYDPEFNLSMDEYLLFLTGKGIMNGTVRFYKNRDCVVIGRFQKEEFEANLEFLKENGINIVARISGGGAVFQDLGNLNISVTIENIFSKTQNLKEEMIMLSSAILCALESFGINGIVGDRGEILVDGKKISGCAASIRYNAMLYHATLLLHVDLEKLRLALSPSYEYPEDFKFIKSMRSKVMNINETAFIDEEELKKRIYREIVKII